MNIISEISHFIPFLVRRGFEKIGYLKPTLVATVSYDVVCMDEEGDEFNETISFFLLEYPTGARIFDFTAYGLCEEQDRFVEYLKDITIWTYGGPLPKGSEKIGAPRIIAFEQ